MKNVNENRFFLETDPKIVGEGAFAIRMKTPLVESGIVSVKFRKGLLDRLSTEESKIEMILDQVNKIQQGIEKFARDQKSES